MLIVDNTVYLLKHFNKKKIELDKISIMYRSSEIHHLFYTWEPGDVRKQAQAFTKSFSHHKTGRFPLG